MDHLEFAALESQALEPTDWDRFVDRCTKLCGHHLHEDHEGKPSFDGSDDEDGYSLDWLHGQFTAGKRPLDVLHNLLWRQCGLHRTR